MRRILFSIVSILLISIAYFAVPVPASAQNSESEGCNSPKIDYDPIPKVLEDKEITITTAGNCFKMDRTYIVEAEGYFERDGLPPTTENTLKFIFPGNQEIGPMQLTVQICEGLGGLCKHRTLVVIDTELSDVDTKPHFKKEQTSFTFKKGAEAEFKVENILAENEYVFFYANLPASSDRDLTEPRRGEPDTNGEQLFKFTIPDEGGDHYTKTLCVTVKDASELKDCIPITISNLPTLEKAKQKTCAVKKNENITFIATNVSPGQKLHWFCVDGNNAPRFCSHDIDNTLQEGESELSFDVSTKDSAIGANRICIDFEGAGSSLNREEGLNCVDFTVSEKDVPDKVACIDNSATPTPQPPPHPPCPDKYITWAEGTTPMDGKFIGCGAIFTGLGFEIFTEPALFISSIFSILLSISGGILLLLIIFSGYQFMTSQGEPEKIQAARERITSAIVGFVFLIFSMVILEAIGVDILHIPGFCKSDDQNCETYEVNEPVTVPSGSPDGTSRTSGPH